MNVLDLLRAKGIEPGLAQRSGKRGPEWWSSCPGCGGDIGSDGLPSNRFHVWPEQNGGSGSFWCRGCEKAGDSVTFLMEFDGKSYPDACRALDIEMKKDEYRTPRVQGFKDSRGRGGKGKEIENRKEEKVLPGDLWIEKAGKLVSWAHEQLLKNKKQMKWLENRGINRSSVEKWKIGWNPGKDGRDLWRPRESWGLPTEMIKNKNGNMVKKRLWIPIGLVIPKLKYSRIQGVEGSRVKRIRIRRPEENPPRYYVLPGSDMGMMTAHGAERMAQRVKATAHNRAFVVVESELDMVLVAQKAGDLVGSVAVGSSSAKPGPDLMERLRKSAVILLAQDYDQAGAKGKTWWEKEFPQAERWPVPAGGDPGEAFQAGVDIRAWIKAGLPKGWFVGRSLLDKKKRGEAKNQKADNSGQMTDGREKRKEERENRREDIPVGVWELVELMKETPVMILNTPKRLKLCEPQKWVKENWEISKRISRLVYMDPDVFDWLIRHPEEKITGGNIL